jgi:5-formyltetrahydrofolate cyclo-ligase
LIRDDPSSDDTATKRDLRCLVSARIAAMSLADRGRADSAIQLRLCQLGRSSVVEFVVGYLAMADEVRVDGFLCDAIARGLPVFLPSAGGGGLSFLRWHPSCRLRRDGEGVLAPFQDGTPLPSHGGLVIVPGRAFDADGGRLGRGRGYYDRALGELAPDHLVVGVGYECQLLARVPREDWDRPVHRVATETREYVVLPPYVN